MFSRKIFSENVTDDFKSDGGSFNYVAEIKIIRIAHKMIMVYDFCIKHNMCAVERRFSV